MIRRRTFLNYGSAVSLGSLLPGTSFGQSQPSLATQAMTAGQDKVVVAGGTGVYAERVKRFFYDPFTAETGIQIQHVGGSYGEKMAKLKAMTQVGNVEWDVLTLSLDSLIAANQNYFLDLGTKCEKTPNVRSGGVEGACVEYGAIFDISGGVLAFNREEWKSDGRLPSDWTDFWDVETFPGPRALPNVGTPWWNLIAALIADGVPADALFPLDLERAFRKLDQIKPHVSVWWKSGDQSQQMFRSGEVVMAMMFAGRARALQVEGFPVDISWKHAPLDASMWGVLKQAQRPLAALALIDFVYSRPKAHADFITETNSSTGLKKALSFVPPDVAKTLPTSPGIWPTLIATDRAWLGDHQEAIMTQWSQWLSS